MAPVVARATRVLDVGCGSGEFTRELAELLAHRTIVGLDVSSDMVAHARRRTPHERVSYTVADLASSTQWHDESFQVATSTMALHWPGPDPAFLAGVLSLIEPGGVFLAGLHGAGSCQEGVDAFEKVAGLDLEGLPTMFKRRSAAAWEKPCAPRASSMLRSKNAPSRRATPPPRIVKGASRPPGRPILSGHVPAAEIDALVAAAARAMMDSMVMTSRLLES